MKEITKRGVIAESLSTVSEQESLPTESKTESLSTKLRIEPEQSLSLNKEQFDSLFYEGQAEIDLTNEYFSFEEMAEIGDEIKIVATSFIDFKSTLNGEEKTIPALKFMSNVSGEVKTYIYAGTKLTGCFAGIKFPCAAKIAYLGKAKSKNGFKFDNFDVKLVGVIQK